MKKALVILVFTAQLSLGGWETYGQKLNPDQHASSLPLLVSGQEPDRVVDWQPVRLTSEAKVFEIVDIKVAGKSIIIGQPFAADNDWLDALTFRVRNVSGKTITVLGFGVAFPELNDSGGVSPMFSITYSAESVKKDSGARKPLMPNEEMDLKLPKDQLAIMRRVSMGKTGTANLSKVNILSGLANFADGSSVGGFSLRRQVPAKP